VKRVDIRPLLRDLSVAGRSVEMSLAVTDAGATTRVEEVWQALGLSPDALLADAVVTRTSMDIATSG
jgi:hypothetical protein